MFKNFQKILKKITSKKSAASQKRCFLHSLWIGVTEHGPTILLDSELMSGKQPLLIKDIYVRLEHKQKPLIHHFDALIYAPPPQGTSYPSFSQFQPISPIFVTLLHPFRGLILLVDHERFPIINKALRELRKQKQAHLTSGEASLQEQYASFFNDPANQDLIRQLNASSFWAPGPYTLSLVIKTETEKTLQHKRSIYISQEHIKQINDRLPTLIFPPSDPKHPLPLVSVRL